MPHHVTQRGNPKQETFFGEEDYQHYLELMAQFCRAEQVAIWAYCLMPNQVHLIVVPQSAESLRRAIGEAHRRYTRSINFREGWRGHLWQGRFASFVMDEDHLLTAARYVELNPVRAGSVQAPSRYRWSSAVAHQRGRDDALVQVAPSLALPIPRGRGNDRRSKAAAAPVDALTAPWLFAVRSDSSRKPRWPAREAPTRGRRGTGRGAPAEGQTRRRFPRP